jgi:raffinose/stachyose/melibiose transport system substrate-binding protein
MQKFWMKQAKFGTVMLVLALLLAACGGKANEGGSTTNSSPSASSASPSASPSDSASPSAPAEPVELTFFTNNADPTAGQGKMEQMLIDQYMSENANVKIKVERLSPDPQYQDKIKLYNASNNLPDIISMWGNISQLGPLVKNNALAEFSREEVADLGFIDAALDGFSIDGKLYGLPRNSDFWNMFYNKKIFADNGINVPTTEAELIDVIGKLSAKKIVPIALAGREPWVNGIWFDTMLQRSSGNWDLAHNGMDGKASLNDPATAAAATAMQQWVDAGAFGKGFLNLDYNAARNMFGQGKAAMYMMGQWEMGMASDTNLSEEVRSNIGAFSLPGGAQGKQTDLPAWFGGGYSVSNSSANKDAAKAFLKWMFKPENWAKGVWQNGITFPAQKYDQFLTGSETPVQKDLSAIFNSATSYSGTLMQDKFSSTLQKEYYDSIQRLEGKKLTPADFAKGLDATAKKHVAEK